MMSKRNIGLYRRKENHKDTVLVTSFTGDRVLGIDATGREVCYEVECLNHEFYLEEPDYSGLEGNLVQYARELPEIDEVLKQILRRIHPGGYFHVGDIVFGTPCMEYYLNLSPSRSAETNLIELPMEIVEIQDIGMLDVLKLKARYHSSEIICLPLYRDRYSKVDGYACLRRYDMPY